MHAKGLITSVAVATLLAQVFAQDISPNNVAVAENDNNGNLPAMVVNETNKKVNANIDEDDDDEEDIVDKHDIAEQVKEAAERGKEAGEKFEEAAEKAEMAAMAAKGKFNAQGADDDEDDEDNIVKAAGVGSAVNDNQSAAPAEESVTSDKNKKKDDEEEDDEEEEEDDDIDADAHHHSSSADGASSSASASFLGSQSSGLPLSFISASGTATSAGKAGAQPTVKAKNAKSGGNIVRVSIGATFGAVLIAAYSLF